MPKTKAQIIAEAQVVKNATEVGENTATRVGTVLEDLAEKINEYVSGRFYGYAATSADLPEGDEVGYAYVGSSPFEIWNFDGTTWSDSGATIANAPVPNMEDIDYNTANELQFANRVYNSTTPDGLGYKILRKSSTFAAQVTEANTIYEIRYDFDLDGQTVNLPAGSVLKFGGGSLSNGTLVGNETIVKGIILFDTITFNGSYVIDSIRISQVIGYSSDYVRLNNFFDLAIRRSNCKDIYLEGEEFTIEYPLTMAINFGTFFNFEDVHGKYIHGEGAYLKDITNLNNNPIVTGTQSVFCFQYCTNIAIDGIKYEAVNFVPHLVSSSYSSADRFDFIQLRGDCSYITLRGEINNARAGLMCNPFIDFNKPTQDKIGSHHIDVDIVSDWTSYPVAFNWGSNVNAKINCSNQHRAAYLCGVNIADIDLNVRTRNVAGTPIMCLISDGCLPLNNEVENTADNRLCRHCSNMFVNFMLDNTNGNATEGVTYQSGNCYGVGFQWYDVFTWRTNPEICSNIKIIIDGRGINSKVTNYGSFQTNTLGYHIDGDCFSDIHFILHRIFQDTMNVTLQNFVKNLIFEYDYKRPSAAATLTFINSYDNNNIIVKGLRNVVLYLTGYLFVENSELVEIYSRGSVSTGKCVVIADEKSTIGTLRSSDAYCPINVYKPSGTNARRPNVLPTFFVGKKYFSTSFGRPLYVKAVNSTTGAVTWVDEKGYTPAISRGTTGERPTDTLTTADAGYQYFDTTLGKPIYFNGTGWLDATGAAV